MAAIAGSQEVRTEVLSESGSGAPIKVTLDHTTVGDVNSIHVMSVAGVVDAVFLEVFNKSARGIDLNLILNPISTSNATNVDDATVLVTIRPKSSLWVLQGQRFRFISGNTYTIGAYVATADVGQLFVTGWVNRQKTDTLTA